MIRHGETDWNRQGLIQGFSDIPLNETGIRQAHIVGEHLAGNSWTKIYTSPLSRAYDTAAIIAEYTGFPDIFCEERLKERYFGQCEGMEGHRRREVFGRQPIPGAETWEDVQVRAFEAINSLAWNNPGARLLAVAHGGVIGTLLSLLSNGEITPGNPPLQNLCMNAFTYDGTWRIEWYNRVIPELERLQAGV